MLIKRIKLNLLFKLSYLNSNFALTLGYLNPALNNPAQDPEFLHQNFQDSTSKKDFRNSGFGFPFMVRALSIRQIRLLSFSSQKLRTISKFHTLTVCNRIPFSAGHGIAKILIIDFCQIISTSRWVKKVDVLTSMLTCIS